jgi:hypothetical protein
MDSTDDLENQSQLNLQANIALNKFILNATLTADQVFPNLDLIINNETTNSRKNKRNDFTNSNSSSFEQSPLSKKPTRLVITNLEQAADELYFMRQKMEAMELKLSDIICDNLKLSDDNYWLKNELFIVKEKLMSFEVNGVNHVTNVTNAEKINVDLLLKNMDVLEKEVDVLKAKETQSIKDDSNLKNFSDFFKDLSNNENKKLSEPMSNLINYISTNEEGKKKM